MIGSQICLCTNRPINRERAAGFRKDKKWFTKPPKKCGCISVPLGTYCNRRPILDKEILTIECWHLPIFTPRRQGTIFGTTGLNFRVRDGNGWTPCVINTNCVLSENSCYYITTFSKMQVFFYNFLINLKFSYYFIVLFDYPR